MVDVRVRTSRRDGVTFATAVVANESSERRRVRLAVDCEGALWPPRRRGVPAAGWDAEGVTVTVAAGGVRGVGFATPAEAVDVERVATERRGDVDAAASASTDPAASDDGDLDGVVRALGSFAPPLAATPREDGSARASDGSVGWDA